MMKALIFENKVVDLAATEFEVHNSMSWMDAPDECQVGWLLNDGVLEPFVPPTPSTSELLASLRRHRDKLLAETDWVTLKAIDDSNDGLGIQLPQVWMDYRQALRDLPANTVDPANPVWPIKPGGN